MKQLLIAFVSLLCCSITFAQRIAVIEFNSGSGLSQADVDGISAIFNTYFSPQGYTLVERSRIDRIIDEQRFQRGRLTEQQMVRIGKLLNISQIVVGDVNVVMNQYNIDVRVLNVESGTIAAKDGATWSPGSSYRDMMQELASRLANQIAIRPTNSYSPSPSAPNEEKIFTLLGYLKIYPEDLGEFNSYPKSIIDRINKNVSYGYDTWRLPTDEELQLIKENSQKISGFENSRRYWTRDETDINPSNPFKIRLVTDQQSKAAAHDAYVLCSAIEDYQDFILRFPSGIYATMAKIKILTISTGHDCVDLGLPSGLLWATTNVGASSPEEIGERYIWGGMHPDEGSIPNHDKFCEDISGSGFDVARHKWGDTWQMPNKSQFKELLDYCSWTRTTKNGKIVYKVVGPNGNFIFFPIAFYWSSTPGETHKKSWQEGLTIFISYFTQNAYAMNPELKKIEELIKDFKLPIRAVSM